ncbi:MAG: nucleoside hydrolase [Oscillospiraceae bacterium]|nr:nucleoside hydrolase [Oscillospiraceae bacterium]
MQKIIIDCDNTFGVEGCDLDDGLAIIYALGTGKCELLGVTTTFGNNNLEVVSKNTVSFMKSIGMEHLPVHFGHAENAAENSAAKFLTEMASKYPGEVSIVGIGSLTNLYHAYLLDATFFDKVKNLSFMGGTTEPLVIMGKVLSELNFSCSSKAAYNVLTKGHNIKIATGNICLDALFTKERFDKLKDSSIPFLQWLCAQGQYWFEREKEYFGHDGIYKWDIYSVAVLTSPELFSSNEVHISPDEDSMKTGNLIGQGASFSVEIPVIKDVSSYIEHVYAAYENFANKSSQPPAL